MRRVVGVLVAVYVANAFLFWYPSQNARPDSTPCWTTNEASKQAYELMVEYGKREFDEEEFEEWSQACE